MALQHAAASFPLHGDAARASSCRKQLGALAHSSRLRFTAVTADVTTSSSSSPFTETYFPKRRFGGVGGNGTTSCVPCDTSATFAASEGGAHWPSLAQCASLNGDSTHWPRQHDPDREPDVSRGGDDENDIQLRLPELREMLEYLRTAQAGNFKGGKAPLGNVFLVGTGPGDPELMTVKAWRLLQRADLVLYDRLVSRDILDMIHPNARLLYVGKASSYHSRTQEEIHELLLRFAEAGATVVRLKGGDPLVFGRGGEEVEFLQAQGIRVDIIPGITSASGIAANLGIPLTHRGLANSVRFLTGHTRKGGEDPLHVAANAADPDSTLVVYMGLASLPGIVSKLMANGLPSSTPAVAVERGTTEWQRNVFAELKDLPGAVAEASLVSPTLVIIGQVVALSRLWPSAETATADSADTEERNLASSNPSFVETRDRRKRGPDPALPSERVGAA